MVIGVFELCYSNVVNGDRQDDLWPKSKENGLAQFVDFLGKGCKGAHDFRELIDRGDRPIILRSILSVMIVVTAAAMVIIITRRLSDS